MGLIEVVWAVLIALKLAGLGTLATTSWWIIIFWPIPVYLVFVIIVIVAIIGKNLL